MGKPTVGGSGACGKEIWISEFAGMPQRGNNCAQLPFWTRVEHPDGDLRHVMEANGEGEQEKDQEGAPR
jgi:hypothetical protein